MCCFLIFSYSTEWLRLANPHFTEHRGLWSPNNFLQWKFNNWLTSQRMSANSFGVRRSYLTKLLYVTCREAKIKIWVQVLGFAPLDFWRAKRPKFGAISDDFALWSQIFLELINISTGEKQHYQLQSVPMQKFGELWSTAQTLVVSFRLTQGQHCACMLCRLQLRSATWLCYERNFNLFILSPSWAYCAGRPRVESSDPNF